MPLSRQLPVAETMQRERTTIANISSFKTHIFTSITLGKWSCPSIIGANSILLNSLKTREQIEKMYSGIQDAIKNLQEEFNEESNCNYRRQIQRELYEERSKASLLREILDG